MISFRRSGGGTWNAPLACRNSTSVVLRIFERGLMNGGSASGPDAPYADDRVSLWRDEVALELGVSGDRGEGCTVPLSSRVVYESS